MFRYLSVFLLLISITGGEIIDAGNIQPLDSVTVAPKDTLAFKSISHYSTSQRIKKNVIGLGVSNFFSNLSLNYERLIKREVGLFIEESVHIFDDFVTGSGFSSQIQLRFHFKKVNHSPLCSRFVAPFVQHTYSRDENYKNTVEKHQLIKIGAVGGRRWIMKNRFSLDLYGGYGFIPYHSVNGKAERLNSGYNFTEGFQGALSIGAVF